MRDITPPNPMTDLVAAYRIDLISPDESLVEQILSTLARANRIDACMRFLNQFSWSESMLFKSIKLVPLLATILYKSGSRDKLFELSNYFINQHITRQESFFVAGLYYMSISRFDVARIFLAKASLTKEGPWGWISYGLSYSFSDESGHAINAFRKTTLEYPKCIVPWIYIGMDYIRTNELKLAQSYLVSALELINGDVGDTLPGTRLYKCVVLNEIGIICLKAQQFDIASENFRLCLNNDNSDDDLATDTTSTPHRYRSVYYSNLGYAYMRAMDIDSAIDAFEQALGVWRTFYTTAKQNQNALAGLGYCYHCKGNLSRAIDLYSLAIGKYVNHASSRKMENFLNNLIQVAISEYAFSAKQSVFVPDTITEEEEHAMIPDERKRDKELMGF